MGGVSLPRMIIGTNWFLGFSHTSVAKDEFIKEHMDRKRVADVMEVFVRAGVEYLEGELDRDGFLDTVPDRSMLDGGPAELVRRYDLTCRGNYCDACHLCDTARHALRERFPEVLAPDQMYGE